MKLIPLHDLKWRFIKPELWRPWRLLGWPILMMWDYNTYGSVVDLSYQEGFGRGKKLVLHVRTPFKERLLFVWAGFLWFWLE